MIRDAVVRASGIAQVVAAGLLAVMGVRFGAAGVLYAMRERAPTLDATGAPSVRPPPSASAVVPLPAPTGSQVKSGAALRVSLVVSGGPDRSELRVDGVKVGSTPYIGEVTCKAGDTVRLELLPPKGVPITHEKKCLPGTLRVGD